MIHAPVSVSSCAIPTLVAWNSPWIELYGCVCVHIPPPVLGLGTLCSKFKSLCYAPMLQEANHYAPCSDLLCSIKATFDPVTCFWISGRLEGLSFLQGWSTEARTTILSCSSGWHSKGSESFWIVGSQQDSTTKVEPWIQQSYSSAAIICFHWKGFFNSEVTFYTVSVQDYVEVGVMLEFNNS